MKPKYKIGDKLKASDFDKEQYGIEYVTITSINEENKVYHWESSLNPGKVHSGYFFKDSVLYEEQYNPYCPICSGCGEEGCCSPLRCKQSPDGSYCESYLNDLKFGYMMYEDVYDLIPKDDETEKKLHEIWEKNYELIYNKK